MKWYLDEVENLIPEVYISPRKKGRLIVDHTAKFPESISFFLEGSVEIHKGRKLQANSKFIGILKGR